MIPTRSGSYYVNNSTSSVSPNPSTPGTVLRAWCGLLADDTVVGYVGTTTKLWVWDGSTTTTDRSKGGGYTNTATDWSFAQYGNYSIATNRVDAVQVRDGSTANAFADLGGSPPKARIAVTQTDQVLLFDLNDGAEKPNAFAACAPGDHTDWSGAGATTATAIRHRPGKIRAAIAFRDYVLVFKRSSVYKLTYTGSVNKWRVDCIAIGRGAWGMHDVVNTGDEVVFSGPGGVWRFDGATFRSCSDWFGEVEQAEGAFFSPLSGNVHFFNQFDFSLPGTDSGCYHWTYNVVSDAWGISSYYTNYFVPMTGDSAALSAFVAPTTAFPDMAQILNKSFTSAVKTDARWAGTVSNSDGVTVQAYIMGGVEGVGADNAAYFGRLVPDWTYSLPSSVTIASASGVTLDAFIGETKDDQDLYTPFSSPVIDARASFGTQRRFDIGKAAPYARFRIDFTGAGYSEIDDYTVEMKPAGKQTT